MATITFGGQQIRRPGAYSVVDSSRMTPSSIGSFKVLAFLGVAPNAKEEVEVAKPYFYNAQTIKQAQEELGDGFLIDALKTAWKHGADLITVVLAGKSEDVPPTDSEWQTAIDVLEQEFIDGIVLCATDLPVITKLNDHCMLMSDVINRKERRAFYGQEVGATKEDIMHVTEVIDTERGTLAYPAVYEFQPDGTKMLRSSILLASAYAGLWAVKGAEDPLTYDYVKFAGVEKRLSYTEIGDLIDAGIMVVEEVKGKGIRIVQAVTMSSSEDLTYKELSVSTLKDMMSKELRDTLGEKHVGKAGIQGIEITVYNDAITIIEGFLKKNWISGYVKDSVKVVKNATTFTVEWEGQPTLPINTFLITSHFTL